MILIKDRHVVTFKVPFGNRNGKYDTYKGSTLAYDDGVSYSFYLGKYDTYKGSTPSFTISINHDFGLGNMILIKDRHHFKFHMFSPLIFTGEKYDTYKGSTRAEWKIWR